ncbi:MAG: hypothetical protein WHU94_02440 [Thermogemmata sp.]|jgi:hypothetical protein|uniref:Uncharacterized protein n=1 Tax=Thermogemmata fonticola TaxID=2755323 RepID=A0A7V8VFM4_9BACT|nr:hypothetical protein [Thermogemmata fonticola]MBA2227066.1 hypothetical protein [Thermogemmata fonticola]MCX8139027.1 hypothetical protein [Gemmataceae bacterium]GIW85505.1 MAG: hypothetical protein KatS3mg107_1165 [Gemmataceae bacterium]
MNTSLYVTPAAPITLPEPNPARDSVELLRQMLQVQQEQLHLMKVQLAAQDHVARCRAFLQRWEGDYPDLGAACKRALPLLERAYVHLLREMAEQIGNMEADEVCDEFWLSEFIDRYGMRLSQLGNIVSQVAPLAEAANTASGNGGN